MATNCILQDLYAQILQSEEQVKERNAKFKAVNEEIVLTQAKTAEIRDELKSLQGNLAIQNNKVAEQELQLKWLKEKERIINVQKQRLEETKMDLQNKFDRVQEERQRERDKFIAECEEFSSTFDLTGEGKRKRGVGKKAKLEELIKNTEKLKSDIDEIKREKAEVDVLEDKKRELVNEIKDLELQHKEADKTIQAEKYETERLRQEKQKLSEKLRNDPELQRLTAELKKCKEESLSLEGINDAMDQELNELRQQYYQKQLRKQREQREQQRQQQLEQHKQQQNKHNQQTRRKPQAQQKQLPPREQPETTSRSKEQKSAYFARQTQGKGVQRPLFERNNGDMLA